MSHEEQLIAETMETLRTAAKAAAEGTPASADRLRAIAESIDWSTVRRLKLTWKRVWDELVPELEIETWPNHKEVIP